MAFTTTAEQDQLRDLVRRACGQGARNRDTHEDGVPGDPGLWQVLRDAGLLTLGLPESAGGAGGGIIDQSIVAFELGRAASPAPFVSSTVLSGAVLQRATPRPDLVERMASGAVLAPALSDPTSVHLEPGTGQPSVSGTIRMVIDGPIAHLLLVAATAGADIVVGVVDAAAATVQRTAHPTLDRGRPVATVRLDGAPIDLLELPAAPLPGGWAPVLEAARRAGAVGLAAESAGVARHCLDLSVSYALTRRQFGEVIGQFQATKHRLADMLVLTENAHAAVQLGAFALAGNGDDTILSAAAAKAVATEAAVRVVGEAIQLHGGIAITWEHDLHLYLRRAKTNQHLLGEPSDHRETIVAGLLAAAARE